MTGNHAKIKATRNKTKDICTEAERYAKYNESHELFDKILYRSGKLKSRTQIIKIKHKDQ